MWNNTLEKYVIASKTQPNKLKQALLYSLIQTGQLKIESEYLDTKFDSLSQRRKTFENICNEVINTIENEKLNITWKLEKGIWEKLKPK